MRRLVFTGTLLAALAPATAVLASTPPDTEPVPASTEATSSPPATEVVASAAPTDTMPAETAAIGTEPTDTATAMAPATIYNEDGDAIATVTVSAIEPSWGDYSTDNAPDEGKEYVRAT